VLAATAPSHCIDGWTFFSRALSALLSGDAHSTRHLAYYAQLRAALSLLHCHGVGIFNRVNLIADESGNLSQFGATNPNKRGQGTHQAAWKALRAWSDQLTGSTEFLSAMKFQEVSLLDCFEAVNPSTATSAVPLVSRVIREWGVDLKRCAKDLESRNISSYCAHALNPAPSEMSARLDLVLSIWRSLEPDGIGGFADLDRHLLRKFLLLLEKENCEATLRENIWEGAYQRLDGRIKSYISRDFLERLEEPDDLPVFRHASEAKSGDVFGMISRALLLLRLATGAVRSAILDAWPDSDTSDLREWFSSVGVDRGFWLPDDPPEHIESLWVSISLALDALDQYASMESYSQLSFFDFLGDQFACLSQAERACMWGVGK